MQSELVAVALCLLGSAFFSASETALTALPVTRLEALRQRSGRLARAGLDRWAHNPQSILITILIGNNLVNVLASALATSIAYQLSADGAIAMVVGVMTLVILVVGEITPKTLAQQHSQWIAGHVTPALYLLDVALTPVVRVLGLLSRVLTRSRTPEVPVTEEDLLFMLRLAHRHATLDSETRLMIESVLRFHRAVAREVMVPRPMVSMVEASWDRPRLQAFLSGSAHSRFPVVEGRPDAIVGVLHAKHLLQLDPARPWVEAVVSPLFIPEDRALPDLLQDFRRSGQHLAIVLDEFGGLSGVVSLEDVLELVVGEIEDEFDVGRESAVTVVDDGWLVPGYLSFRRLEAVLQREVRQPEEVDSVGGLAAELLGAPVEEGATFNWDGLELRVEQVEEGRAARLRVRPLPVE